MSKSGQKPFHLEVADRLIEQMKQGTAPWQRPWDKASFMPMNPSTGKRYKGINALSLMMRDYDDPRWMTYKQAQVVGAQVKKGESGTSVQYWKFEEERIKKNEHGKPELDREGKPVKEVVRLERPKVFFAKVFNAEQIEGLPSLEVKKHDWNPVERAEQILTRSGAEIHHDGKGRAFYRPSSDSIHLPTKESFHNAEGYYGTALHELGHWTGHSSRLDRPIHNPFGSIDYAKEELRAEIAGLLIGNEVGVDTRFEHHASYVDSWADVLKKDPLEIIRAATDAEKILDYVVGLEQKHTREQVVEEEIMANKIYIVKGTIASEDGSTPVAIHSNGDIDYLRVGGREVPIDDLKKFNSVDDAELAKHLHKVVDGGLKLLMESGEALSLKIYEVEKGHLQEVVYQPKHNFDEPGQERIYIDVPFSEKEEAKGLGARWDRQQQSWYLGEGADKQLLERWPIKNVSELALKEKSDEVRTYLAVPYEERLAAKALGAKWDKRHKSWYVNTDEGREATQRWHPGKAGQDPVMNPREEFSNALQVVGCIVSGEHPVMDGKPHRIRVEGDSQRVQDKAGSGFYVGHVDGHPAGYVKNNRSGIDLKWKAKGYSLDPEQKAQLQAEAAMKLAKRAAEQAQLHEETASRVQKQLAGLHKLTFGEEPTPYLERKGVSVYEGVYSDSNGKTYIPAQDAEGKIWTMQVVLDGDLKRFAKDSKKEGCFHIIGGVDLDKVPHIAITEGYATGATIKDLQQQGVVVAFDSGNLKPVAEGIRAKYPDKPIVIFGDDDQSLELTLGSNPGRVKAKEAASAVNGTAVFPVFAVGEAEYPANIERVSPSLFKKHIAAQEELKSTSLSEDRRAELERDLLKEDQVAALQRMKRFTDFNDLAQDSSIGKDGLSRQVSAAIAKVEKQSQGNKQSKSQKIERRERRAATVS